MEDRSLPLHTLCLCLGLGLSLPSVALGDVNVVQRVTLDQRGRVVHAVPRSSTTVRMAAEEVVMVPFFSRRRMRPMMLVNVWYDLHNAGSAAVLEVGFPEMRGRWTRHTSTSYKGEEDQYIKFKERWPTIEVFGARVGRRWLEISTLPGLGPYQRWFAWAVALPGKKKVRLRNVYIAGLGRRFEGSSMASDAGEDKDYPGESLKYWFTYVLHTGRSWRGPIGKGEILMYSRGLRRTVRTFVDLEPTAADDVSVELPIVRTIDPAEGHRFFLVHKNRLIQESSTLKGKHLIRVGALTADGDPATRWTSARGRARGAWIQLPADPGGKLKDVEVVAGDLPKGEVRPAKIDLICLRKGKKKRVARAELKDQAAAQNIPIPKPARCDAIRLQVRGTHGDPRKTAVSIAEIRQLYAAAPRDKAPRPLARDKQEDYKPLLGEWPSPARGRPAPAGTWPGSFERDQILNVQWSRDGSLVHYQRWQEDRVRSPRGIILGHFADAATGKALGSYRVARFGALPPDLAARWDGAVTYHQASAFMDRHGFAPGKPSTPVKLGLAASRSPRYKKKSPWRITRHRAGWRWRHLVALAPKTDAGQAALELTAPGPDPRGARRRLFLHAPGIDLALARHHVSQRGARVKSIRADGKRWVASTGGFLGNERDDNQTSEGERLGWWDVLLPREAAHTGRVRVHWSPSGDALLVAWQDRQELSSRLPPFKATALVAACMAQSGDCPKNKAEYGRQRTTVSIHALTDRKPTTLRVPAPRPKVATVTPPPARKKAPGRTASSNTPGGKKAGGKKADGGCATCAARPATGGPWFPLAALLLWGALRFGRRTR